MTENTQWKWCYRSLLSAVIFAFICISAFNFIDGMSGGYAIAFVALIMMILAGEGGFITGVFLLTFTVLLFIVSRVAPMLALKNALTAPKEAYIAENGIIYEGAVYPFHSFLMRMEGVTFKKRTGKKPAVLIFSFIQFVGLNITSPFEIGIPVPGGEEETACKIVDMLGK